MRLRPLIAALLAAGLLLGACSTSKPSAKETKEDLSDALQDGADALTAKQADCYADLIVDEVGADEVNDVGFNATKPNAKLAEQLADIAQTARSTCDLDTP